MTFGHIRATTANQVGSQASVMHPPPGNDTQFVRRPGLAWQ